MATDDPTQGSLIAVASRQVSADPSLPLSRRLRQAMWLRALPLCGALAFIGSAFLPWFTITEDFGALAHARTTRTAWSYWSGVSGVCAAVIIVIVWLTLLLAPRIAHSIFLPSSVTFGFFGALALGCVGLFALHGQVGEGPRLPGVTYQYGYGAVVASVAALVVVVFGVLTRWPGVAPRLTTSALSQPLILPRDAVYSQPLPYSPLPSRPLPTGSSPSQPLTITPATSRPLPYGSPPSQPLPYLSQPSQPLSFPGQPALPPVAPAQPSQPIVWANPFSAPLPSVSQPAPPAQRRPARSLPMPFGEIPAKPSASHGTPSDTPIPPSTAQEMVEEPDGEPAIDSEQAEGEQDQRT